MYEPLVSGGTVRKVWDGETELYRQHLLRLDAESRRNRFGGAVSERAHPPLCRPFRAPRRGCRAWDARYERLMLVDNWR